jgi:hypothetical protein
MTRAPTTADGAPLRRLLSTLAAVLIWLALVVLTYIGAGFGYVVLYDQFEEVTTAYKIAFWSVYVGHVLLTIGVAAQAAWTLRLPVRLAVTAAMCFLAIVAWPTIYIHSAATSCELGDSYPIAGLPGCD